MKKDKDLLKTLAEALSSIDDQILYYFDTKKKEVVKFALDLHHLQKTDDSLIKIEPIVTDIVDLMEDFALDQETEIIQEHLTSLLKQKDPKTAMVNFQSALIDYPRSQKEWSILFKKWIADRAKEYVEDYLDSKAQLKLNQ